MRNNISLLPNTCWKQLEHFYLLFEKPYKGRKLQILCHLTLSQTSPGFTCLWYKSFENTGKRRKCW